ncbi:MAG: hypothetical protein ACYTAS_14965 [Planctomycetota bacterium]|jgi:hypothetical protein
MNEGYIMLRRGYSARQLLQDANAFILLTVIALRAKRTSGFSVHGLQIGQALIGDFKVFGLTEGQYRAAKVRLKRYGLAHFKGTNKGTVATVLNDAVFDINADAPRRADGEPATNEGHTDHGRATTNKNEKNGENERRITPSAEADGLAALLFDLIRESKADFRKPNLHRWAREMDRLIRLDDRAPERIEAVIRWCRRDPFWQSNILSPAALRKHFDRLELQRRRHPPRESLDEMIDRLEQEDKQR